MGFGLILKMDEQTSQDSGAVARNEEAAVTNISKGKMLLRF